MLQQLFEKCVLEHPDRLAIVFENNPPLTYSALDLYSNQLAHLFLLKGIRVQTYVPVILGRGEMQVIVFLALLKIGAIYVPISAEQSSSQLKQILDDCKPKHIITHSYLARQLKITEDPLSLICLDREEVLRAKQTTTKPVISELRDDFIAYVAYSSGTTGRPKGIPIKHLGMTHYWYPVLKDQVKHPIGHVLANISIDFDAHIWEYLMAWSFGATLHMTNEETRKDMGRLTQFILHHKVSDITCTPPILRTFTDTQIECLSKNGLKAVYSTGEALTMDIVSAFLRQGISIYNCYGPTEATFGLSMVLCKPEAFYDNVAPIGLPPANSPIQLKILNAQGQETDEGELVMSSPYLTPGYLNTKSDKFFTEKPQGPVFYKTGDKFEKRNGRLYYKGRAHSQAHIKIRGQFVDLLGTEEVLRRHPQIKDVSLSVRNDLGPEPCLVAFIVSNKEIGVGELRRYCAKVLKPSSIPRYIITLDKLPLTNNGKTDTKLLSEQEIIVTRDTNTPYVLPLTQLETLLIGLWKKTLGVSSKLKIEQIGANDTFAVLGGDSIKLMLLKRQIEETLGVSVNIAELGSLEELTVEAMAYHVYAKLILKNADRAIQLVKQGDKTLSPLFLLPPISGESILTYQRLCAELKCPQEVYAIEAPGLSDSKISTSSISKMAQAYLALIRTIQPRDPLCLAGWSSGGLLAYEMALQLERDRTPAAFVGIVDEPSPQLQSIMSNEVFASELVDLIAYFKQRHHFSFECKALELSKLSKREQILQAFSKISNSSQLADNLLEYMKVFLLATLDYNPPKLESTPLALFSTVSTISKYFVQAKDPTLGWSKYSKLYVMLSELNGDHFSIIDEPKELVDLMGIALKKMVWRPVEVPTNNDMSEWKKSFAEMAEKINKTNELLKAAYERGKLPFFVAPESLHASMLEPHTAASHPRPRAFISSKV